MTTELTKPNGQIDDRSLLTLVSDGDCGRLTEGQRLAYYRARCDAAGLDYRAQPFQFVKLNNKLVLYALKACSDQLAAKHGIKTHILDQETTADGLRVVTVRAATKDGRETDDIGAVNVKGLTGEALANALMKAATKAKRRAVLSVCGLGMLDETEIETIPKAQPVRLSVKDDGAVTVDGQVTTDETLPALLAASVKNGAAAPHAEETPGAVQSGTGLATRPDPSGQPQHDTPGQIAGRLLGVIDHGFENQFHWENWMKKHDAEIQHLPWQLKKRVLQAHANADPQVSPPQAP